jgi:hypothetical protein
VLFIIDYLYLPHKYYGLYPLPNPPLIFAINQLAALLAENLYLVNFHGGRFMPEHSKR